MFSKFRFCALWFCLLAFMAGPAAGAPALRVVTPSLHPSSAAYAAYFPRLLRLALEKTRAEGPFEIVEIDQFLTSPRQATEIRRNGIINLMWDGSNRQREAEMYPVRVSLLGQLNDYRIFLIRAGDQERFSAIRSVQQLRALKAGAGVNWPSTEVLRANALPVVTSIAYENLFPMLHARRFDYLPRGVHEAANEQRTRSADNLAVEQTIFLHYHVPFYFFVSHENAALGQRVERGLQLALKDGSFDQLFNSIPAFRAAQAEIDSHKRRVFALKTP